MCIRDSAWYLDLAGVYYAGADSPVPEGSRVIPTLILGYEPVSYTHLRAHETVLDLVCRLLLDKKQHKVSYTIIVHMTVSMSEVLAPYIRATHTPMTF